MEQLEHIMITHQLATINLGQQDVAYVMGCYEVVNIWESTLIGYFM